MAGFEVNHNIPALRTYNALSATTSSLQKSIQKLSTGLRINSASDDAAGLAISEKMRAQIRGLDRAGMNAQDGISMIQTAEGALNETHSILQRMRELSVQAANDTLTQQDRGYIQLEIDELRDEVTRIGNTTQFNKKKLLDGSAAVLWSSDDLSTKAVVNGGLRQIDQFGQKASAEGNFKISLKAQPGVGEAQKTDIFRVKHEGPQISSTSMNKNLSTNTETMAYELQLEAAEVASTSAFAGAAATGVAANVSSGPITATMTAGAAAGFTVGDLKLEVTRDGTTNNLKVTVKEGWYTKEDGSNARITGDFTFAMPADTAGTETVSKELDFGGGVKVTVTLNSTNGAADFNNPIELTWAGPNTSATDNADFKVMYGNTLYNLSSESAAAAGSIMYNDYVGTTSAKSVNYKYDLERMGTDPAASLLALSSANASVKVGEVSTKTVAASTVKYNAVATDAKDTQLTLVDSYKKDNHSTFDNIDFLKTMVDTTNITGANVSFKGEVQNITYSAGAAAGMTVKYEGTYWGTDGVEHSMGNVTVTYNTAGAVTNVVGASNAYVGATNTLNGSATAGGAAGAWRFGDNDSITFKNLTVNDMERFQFDDITTGTAGTVGGTSNDSIVTNPTNKGDRFSLFVSNSMGADMGIQVKSSDGTTITYNFNSAELNNGSGQIALKQYAFDNNGEYGKATDIMVGATVSIPDDFKLQQIGDIAEKDTKLFDLEKFWNSEGRFLIEDPQTITITQGDGKQTSIVLYADDTMQSFVDKLNKAIGEELGQNRYVTGQGSDLGFATYVDEDTAAEANAAAKDGGQDGKGAKTVAGTIVINSVVTGDSGRLTFSGDEDIIKALSMNELQKAEESRYSVTITNAHTGKEVVSNEEVTGNKLIGLVDPNVDVMFDSMAGTTATYNEDTGYFEYEGVETDTFLHLADNTTVFQIGANEGEDMGVNFGDMRSEALGLNKVLVTDRDSASRSITILDSAIDKVSMQRAKLGAYQNRLEHTINNLTVASENMTAAESRIRDTDMAKEMMNFTKLQIMMQAGTSMLAQANGLPQNVLSLIR